MSQPITTIYLSVLSNPIFRFLNPFNQSEPLSVQSLSVHQRSPAVNVSNAFHPLAVSALIVGSGWSSASSHRSQPSGSLARRTNAHSPSAPATRRRLGGDHNALLVVELPPVDEQRLHWETQ
jgi:hypothetical protein